MSQTEKFISLERQYYAQVFPRHPVVLVEGRGAKVWDVEGREYLDLTAGWGVCCLGHSHPKIIEAIARQSKQLMQVSNLFYTVPQSRFAQRLVQACPDGIDRAFFVNSGTEAVEGALKLARRATGKTAIISTLNSFHGRTLGALSATGQPKHQASHQPLLPGFQFVPYNDLAAISEAITEHTAAVILEPIQGEGGVQVAETAYLRGVRELCDSQGILLILDEIQTGIGRTGAFLGCMHAHIVPDILCLGKGIGGGFPLAAFLASERVMRTCELGDHGGTYSGNPLACAVGDAVIETLLAENLAERAWDTGKAAMTRLRKIEAAFPTLIREVRGKGLLIGVELISDEAAKMVVSLGIERGVLYNRAAGNVIRLFPPLNIPEELLWHGLDAFGEILKEVA